MNEEKREKDRKNPESFTIGSISSHWEFDENGKLRRVVVEFEGEAEGTVMVLPPIK